MAASTTSTVSLKDRNKESQSQSQSQTTTTEQSPSPSPSLVKQCSNFANHRVGLEKTLRLVQAIAQVGAGVLSDTDEVLAKRCALFRGQIALSRRHFRFFRFFECFERTSALLFVTGQKEGSQSDPVRTTLEFGKWSCLGIYNVMENLTILPDNLGYVSTFAYRTGEQLDAMGVYPTSWSGWVLFEAHKFWFYSLTLSLLGSLWMLLVTDKASPWVKRLVIDGCDLLTPGSMVGWIAVSPVVVGMCMVVSTLLAAQDIWEKAQSQARV